ncbi:MAG: aspartate/glutamate racemase family protein [Sediminibacterium sp.]|nr:aspartate/glutamate racemase family protein [Sediminibacterium sp.]
MKTIGIVGGISWLSTIEYYKFVNQLVNERLGGVNAARVIIYSVNFADIKRLTEADDWDGLTAMISEAAQQLEKAGANCLLVGANTMHKIADRVQAAVNIPLIHVAVVTAEAIKKKNLQTVALLGTKYVMQQEFYRNKLSEQGINILIPEQEDIDYINNAIYTEFGKGIFLPGTKQRFLEIIDKLVVRGAEGVIFGCTEIPILIQADDCSIPVFDTTLIHSTAAVDFALK